MSRYPYSEQGDRGTWRFAEEVDTKKKIVLFACPNCGVSCALKDFEIDAEGLVFPSVPCPEQYCSFNSYIELKDWKP